MTIIYRLIGHLLEPDRFLLLWLTLALGWLWWRQRDWRRRLLIVIVPFALLMIVSLPITAHFVEHLLQGNYQHLSVRPDDANCIVVLAGCAFPRDVNRPDPVLCPDSLYRCLHAAELYRSSGRCRVMASGGVVNPQHDMPPLSHQMRDFLMKVGVDEADLIVEDKSTTTYENAIECARICSEQGLNRAVLVTNAGHMRRAEGCFRHAGVDVVPAPCGLQNEQFDWSMADFFPSAYAACSVKETCHEALGLIWYKLKGRIE